MATKYLSPKQYSQLSEDDQDWYAPEYKAYKDKKRRVEHSCDCGFCHREYEGWETIQIPIGEPYRYRKLTGFMAEFAIYMTRRQRDFIRSNILVATPLKPSDDNRDKTISFTRHTGLDKDAKA